MDYEERIKALEEELQSKTRITSNQRASQKIYSTSK